MERYHSLLVSDRFSSVSLVTRSVVKHGRARLWLTSSYQSLPRTKNFARPRSQVQTSGTSR